MTTNRLTPVAVSGLSSGVVAIAAGGAHTCALTAAGGVKCWGENNLGQLGDGTTTSRTTPVNVSGLASGVSALTAGYEYTCALLTGGGVKCWGKNWKGGLGDGTTIAHPLPADVVNLATGVAPIVAGDNHTCVRTNTSGIMCWGDNVFGQLGDGTFTQQNTPVGVSGLTSGVSRLTVGDSHTCAATAGGQVKCWGENTYGQLGDGTTVNRTTPVSVTGWP